MPYNAAHAAHGALLLSLLTLRLWVIPAFDDPYWFMLLLRYGSYLPLMTHTGSCYSFVRGIQRKNSCKLKKQQGDI